MPNPIKDPLTGFRYAIEIGGIIQADFIECSQVSMSWQVHKYKEGGVNNFEHQLPTRLKAAKITLKYGTTVSADLWQWCAQGIYDGNVKYVNMSIVMYSPHWEEIKRWNLERAFPMEWKGPSLSADSKKVAIESLTIAFHGLQME